MRLPEKPTLDPLAAAEARISALEETIELAYRRLSNTGADHDERHNRYWVNQTKDLLRKVLRGSMPRV